MVLTKEKINTLELKDYNKYPILNLNGENDENGFQIFTPKFIVRDMIDAIGVDKIIDINKTILEPTSGDGAFTVRILDLRLKYIIEENLSGFLYLSSIALSTIYSIEMDAELLIKQRNNLFSLIKYYLSKYKIKYDEKYIELVTDIIKTNVIWGETNIRTDRVQEEKGNAIIGWYMPTEIKTTKMVYEEKKIKITNLFGEQETVKVKSNNKIEKIHIKSNRSKSNRIKIYEWYIEEELSYAKKNVPIEVE